MIATVELSDAAAAAIAAGIVLLLLILLIRAIRVRRALTRRVSTAAVRIEEVPLPEQRGLDRALSRIERAIDGAALRINESTVEQSRLRSTLDQLPQGVVMCNELGEVGYRNRAAAAFSEARHGDALVAGAIDELLAQAIEGRAERRTLDLFGPPRRTVVISASPLDDEHRTIGGVAIIEDVSERRRLEAVRRDFVANISHELKTPVGALGLLAETLLAEAEDQDEQNPVVQRLAERMLEEAFRVGRTIDDLLELSRIEAEEAPFREPVPAHLVLAEAVERIRPAAEHQGIEIRVSEPRRSVTILGDRRQLVSALYNLLDNAVKYSDTGSSVELSVEMTNGKVTISVVDHGIGIPARDLERIFERFYRVDRARSRETGGTGLGLAIVRHVASNHAGEVDVKSREGEGSTFTLVLPAGAGAGTVVTTERAG